MGPDLFLALSTELSCMILCSLDEPRDLYSIVGTSPNIYMGTFAGSRKFILQSVIKNAFRSMVLPDAVVAARLLGANELLANDHDNRQQL